MAAEQAYGSVSRKTGAALRAASSSSSATGDSTHSTNASTRVNSEEAVKHARHEDSLTDEPMRAHRQHDTNDYLSVPTLVKDSSATSPIDLESPGTTVSGDSGKAPEDLATTPSPRQRPQKRVRDTTNLAIRAELGSESELSELDETPAPPNQLLRDMEQRAHKRLRTQRLGKQIRCSCLTRCTCPSHSAWPKPSPLHFSEYALSYHQPPVSAVRPKLYTKEAITHRPFDSGAIALLQALSGTNDSTLRAKLFLRHLDLCFPPPVGVYINNVPGQQRLLDLLEQWRVDSMEKDELFMRFLRAVDGNLDLAMEFQRFFPEEWERKEPEEIQEW